ncbi:hypothetical protein [Caulobacter sp.]|uniref:hypothetical protein n=1 Tax=Caulobacter sp. TaxID=78 RepID=UPI002B498B35|nr:hypothetical protein [Caulobacter sp.]HJV42381.1 hypothetical protein [Caulobacter sp.]
MKDVVTVEPCYGVGRTGRPEGYVIICVPAVGAALSIEASRQLRTELEQAENALLQAMPANGTA